MTRTTEFDIHDEPAVRARLARLTHYRAMQLRLDRDRRKQTARRRLLALHGPPPWGWLAL